MAIPSEINEIIQRLNQELNEIEQDAAVALNLVRQRLVLFAGNEVLTLLLAEASTILNYVNRERENIRLILEDVDNADAGTIEEAAQDLSMYLGRAIEVKMRANRLRSRLEL
jgi:GTP1/Obg family GTP-binding protein